MSGVENKTKIVITTDFSELSEVACQFVKQSPALFSPDHTSITLLHVVEDAPNRLPYVFAEAVIKASGLIEKARDKAEIEIKKLADKYFSNYETDTVVLCSDASVHTTVETFAEEQQANLIVIASHGRSGLGAVLMGSNAQRLVQHSIVPTLVVPCRRVVSES